MIVVEKSSKKFFGKTPDLKEAPRTIPVLDIRSVSDHSDIAKAFADGKRVAMFGGVWGVFKAVPQDAETEEYFHRVKKGRPKEAKIAMLVPPNSSIDLIDWESVHPDFHNLKNLPEYEKLWNSHGAFLHIIAPVIESALIPDVFKTSPQDYRLRYPNADQVDQPSAAFIWRDDPFLQNVTSLISDISSQNLFIGVSTLNAHGQEPPYIYEDLVKQLNTGQIDPSEIDLIVRDSIYEKQRETFGSHTQIRLPLKTEKPVLKVLRLGTLSVEGFRQATNFDAEKIKGVKDVRRRDSINIDQPLSWMSDRIRLAWESRG